MLRLVIAFAALAATAACAARAENKDAVKEKLFAAKVAYDKEMAAFRKAATEWLDKREAAARNAGDKAAVEQVKTDRKAFEDFVMLPKTAPVVLAQKPVAARKALETAYADAVRDYTKAKRDDEAAAVEKELEAFKRTAAAWVTTFPPGRYTVAYDAGGVKATVELRRDGTFTRTRDGKAVSGTVTPADGKLVFRSDVFVEVWTAAAGSPKVDHFWPLDTYPKGKPQARGTATPAKE